ncbi:MAG: OmpA family protein [Alphaproteobacteria bacterium]|nr:OmpA family protein [Alphaproteobacteria bacterium]
MKHSIKLLLAGVVLLAAAGAAHAETGKTYVAPVYKGGVHDSNGKVVRSSNGNCVRTQWPSATDECAPQPLPITVALAERTVYFAFGKSALTEEGKRKLDTLAETIKSHDYIKVARVVGYADRIGKASANEKLSKKRADNVRKYLVSKGVADAKVIETRWLGDSKPVTKCPKKGMKKKELIQCLEQDRRVEVELYYTMNYYPPQAPAPVPEAPAAE